MEPRKAEFSRKTSETDVHVAVTMEAGPASVDTGVPFFDHLLRALAFHGRLGLNIRARGDLEVDEHHLVEDTGLALGEALARLVEQGPVERFGHAVAPMDEALAEVAVDVRRPADLGVLRRVSASQGRQLRSGPAARFLRAWPPGRASPCTPPCATATTATTWPRRCSRPSAWLCAAPTPRPPEGCPPRGP